MNRRLSLDYVGTPDHPWLGKALLGTGIVAAIGTCLFYQQLSAQYAAYQQERAKTFSLLQQATSGATPDPQAIKVAAQAADVADRLSVPWETLFHSLEMSNGDDIALLALDVHTTPNAVSLSAEARDFTAMTRYLERLQEQSAFSQVELRTQQLLTEDPQHPIRFEVAFLWGVPR